MSRRSSELPSWLPIDPYILALLGDGGPGGAPARPRSAARRRGTGRRPGAVALLFFLYGARLSTREALEGLRHWRLHLTVLACTFVLFPLLGLAAPGARAARADAARCTPGCCSCACVPSTIQSSIAFTSIARGNVPAAICARLVLQPRSASS